MYNFNDQVKERCFFLFQGPSRGDVEKLYEEINRLKKELVGLESGSVNKSHDSIQKEISLLKGEP